jgi:hypothetical protein
MLGLALLGNGCRCGASSQPPPAVVAGPAIATCAKVVGEVEVRRAGQGFFEPLAAGSVLRAGDWVRTGDRAFTRLAFLSGGELELLERAAVVVDLSTVTPADGGVPIASPEIALKEGFVRGTLGGASPLSRLTIKTKDGTELRLAPRSAGAALTYRLEQRGDSVDVAVLQGEGTLVVGGTERTLRTGQVSVVRAGASTEAVPLIEFPESVEPGIDARFLYHPGMHIQLTWSSVKGAGSYQVQIARDLSFQELEVTGYTTETSFDFHPPHGGAYAWRVASRDASSRLGEYGFARRVFCEEQVPKDLLLAPTDGIVIPTSESTAPVSFSWQSAAETLSYRLVIAADEDLLKQPLVERLISDQRIQIPGLAPGSYAWGVYVAGDISRPIFLKPRHFTIKRVATAHLKTVKAISEWGK